MRKTARSSAGPVTLGSVAEAARVARGVLPGAVRRGGVAAWFEEARSLTIEGLGHCWLSLERKGVDLIAVGCLLALR